MYYRAERERENTSDIENKVWKKIKLKIEENFFRLFCVKEKFNKNMLLIK